MKNRNKSHDNQKNCKLNDNFDRINARYDTIVIRHDRIIQITLRVQYITTLSY